jgi:hypothetical protein
MYAGFFLSLFVVTVITNFHKKTMGKNERLSAWLRSGGKDYQEGVKIFCEISLDKEMIRFFAQKHPQKVHRSILLMKLSNYARIHRITAAALPEKTTVIKSENLIQVKRNTDAKLKSVILPPEESAELAVPVIQRPKVDKNPVVRYEDLPEGLQILFDQNGKMYSEMKAFHAELKLIKDNEQQKPRRAILAEEILKMEKAIRENWDVIDAWWKKHLEADPLKMAAEEALAKDRRIKANLAYIRRFLGKAKAKEEVEQRMSELDKWNIVYGNLTKNWDGVWA